MKLRDISVLEPVQSYKNVITGKICELNDRTKDEKPDDFVLDETKGHVST